MCPFRKTKFKFRIYHCHPYLSHLSIFPPKRFVHLCTFNIFQYRLRLRPLTSIPPTRPLFHPPPLTPPPSHSPPPTPPPRYYPSDSAPSTTAPQTPPPRFYPSYSAPPASTLSNSAPLSSSPSDSAPHFYPSNSAPSLLPL